ncbi:hypothetical protein [Aliivibrio kagoshimensis]|uniref:hypothetical protein n=1 Tax=Aliivibrio kagoshimensis TaxID=2910230 RepID=UPI003D14B13E
MTYFKHIALIFLTLFSFQAASQTGGKCDFIDMTEFAQVTGTQTDEDISVLTSSGQTLQLYRSDFTSAPEGDSYYKLSVRHHISGGCSPYSIQSITPLEKQNVQLTITAGQAYQAAFILAEAKSCALQSPSDCNELQIDPGFDYRNSERLSDIDVRSVSSCSPAILQTLWSEIISEPAPKVVACVTNQQQQEILVEFTREIVATERENLQLLTLH